MMSERMKDAPHPPFLCSAYYYCLRLEEARCAPPGRGRARPDTRPAKRAASGRKAVVYFVGAVEN
jgi:hypothetical protein